MKRLEKVNELRKILDKGYKFDEGVIRFTTGEGLSHVLKKAEVCFRLRKLGIPFYTEARMVQGRADILCYADDPVAIEIVSSESELSLVNKRNKYPVCVAVVMINEKFDERCLY